MREVRIAARGRGVGGTERALMMFNRQWPRPAATGRRASLGAFAFQDLRHFLPRKTVDHILTGQPTFAGRLHAEP
jgi:hypothetical protein